MVDLVEPVGLFYAEPRGLTVMRVDVVALVLTQGLRRLSVYGWRLKPK